jgi:fructuronate reductase
MGTVAASTQLRRAALAGLPEASRPMVVPGDVRPGIVHIGLGAFHRAHQAVFTETALARAGGDWGIVAVAPRTLDVARALADQDHLFSVTSLDGAGRDTRVVGSIAGVRHAASDPAAVVALLADPAVRIVTLTVTEKAYRLDPATGRLQADADLVDDLTTDRPPRTVPGLLVRGLLARARAGAGPVALVSCDNLPSNGQRLAGLVNGCLALPRLIGAAELERFVAGSVTFPGTMVDRIVPATTPETLAHAERALGVADAAAVAAEPFMQWVIEDDFPAGRPAWDLAGAILTDDAGPWERLKLRALNGVHSAVAYLGALAGYDTIAEAIDLPGLRTAMRRLVSEDVAPSFTPPAGVSVVDYGDSVLTRFGNPAIGHRTLQVAMDGTQKLPQRVLHTMLDRRAVGAEPRWGALVVAAWMRFAAGVSDDGRALPLDDPLAPAVRAALAGASDPVAALLRIESVFPPELAADDVVRSLIAGWLDALTRHGVRQTLQEASRA